MHRLVAGSSLTTAVENETNRSDDQQTGTEEHSANERSTVETRGLLNGASMSDRAASSDAVGAVVVLGTPVA